MRFSFVIRFGRDRREKLVVGHFNFALRRHHGCNAIERLFRQIGKIRIRRDFGPILEFFVPVTHGALLQWGDRVREGTRGFFFSLRGRAN